MFYYFDSNQLSHKFLENEDRGSCHFISNTPVCAIESKTSTFVLFGGKVTNETSIMQITFQKANSFFEVLLYCTWCNFVLLFCRIASGFTGQPGSRARMAVLIDFINEGIG
jgi:hypothetical protein